MFHAPCQSICKLESGRAASIFNPSHTPLPNTTGMMWEERSSCNDNPEGAKAIEAQRLALTPTFCHPPLAACAARARLQCQYPARVRDSRLVRRALAHPVWSIFGLGSGNISTLTSACDMKHVQHVDVVAISPTTRATHTHGSSPTHLTHTRTITPGKPFPRPPSSITARVGTRTCTAQQLSGASGGMVVPSKMI